MYETMSMKEAVKRWENENKQKIATATEIKLTGVCPSLEKMDTVMLSFVSCEKLSLSSNCIERITNLGNMKNLKILSLGRNNIKSISGIEACGETLEELWISYNQIDKLKGIGAMKKLRVLTMSNNHVREWVEFQRLAEVTTLRELVFIGNPLEERCSSEGIWRSEVARRLPGLAKLDGHQCMMEAEVNLNDTQTELQKSSPSPIEDDEKAELGDDEEGYDEGSEEDDNNEEQVNEVRKEASATDGCDRNNEPEKIVEEDENPIPQEEEKTNIDVQSSNNINIDSEETQSGPHHSEE